MMKKLLIIIIAIGFLANSAMAEYPIVTEDPFDNFITEKFIVTWTVTNMIMIPCDHTLLLCYDEYGRKNERNAMTLELCYETDISCEEKRFFTYEEAQAFIDQAEAICRQDGECGMKDFAIKEIE